MSVNLKNDLDASFCLFGNALVFPCPHGVLV